MTRWFQQLCFQSTNPGGRLDMSLLADILGKHGKRDSEGVLRLRNEAATMKFCETEFDTGKLR